MAATNSALAPRAFHVYLLEGKARGANPQNVSSNIMKCIVAIMVVVILGSCDNVITDLDKSAPVVEEIISEMNATSGQIAFTELKDNKTGAAVYYIDFNLDSCEFLQDSAWTKNLISSYCAMQLYLRLDSSIISKYSAINVVFDDPQDIFNKREYYYHMEALREACNTLNQVDLYLNYLGNNDIASANALLDTSYYKFNSAPINSDIKKQLIPPFKAYNFYEPHEFVNDTGKVLFPCYSIRSIVRNSDSSQVYFSFLIPKSDSNNRIIGIQP